MKIKHLRGGPSGLYDFDINFRMIYLKKRSDDSERAVWSPARWQNLVLGGFGVIFILGFYVVPAYHWNEIRQADTIALVLVGIVLAVLLLPLVAMIGAGLFHWKQLVVDKRNRVLIARRKFAKKADAVLGFDEILCFETDTVLDDSGGEVSRPWVVLFAELKDGRRAGISADPSDQLVRELRALLRERLSAIVN